MGENVAEDSVWPPSQPAARGAMARRAEEFLRDMVHEGVLLPGQPVHQAAMAEKLGISRVPVREALKSLQAVGLVEPGPAGGFAVVRLSAEELDEMYLMRELLESEVLRRLRAVSRDEVDALAGLNRRISELVEAPTHEQRALNREFHFRMFRLSGLGHVVNQIDRLWTQSEPYRSIYTADRDARSRIVTEHDAILAALRQGDIEALVKAMNVHRNASRRDVTAVLSQPGVTSRGSGP